MSGHEAMCLLVLFAVALSAVTGTEEKFDSTSLTIKDLQVSLICPLEERSWYLGRNKLKNTDKEYNITVYGEKDNSLYYCNKTDENQKIDRRFYFYTKIKVCENCVELDVPMAAGIVVGDILFTLGVILVVFLLARKKAPPAPPQRPVAHARQTSAPAQDPNYQSLNPATRNKDIYAEAARKN